MGMAMSQLLVKSCGGILPMLACVPAMCSTRSNGPGDLLSGVCEHCKEANLACIQGLTSRQGHHGQVMHCVAAPAAC